MGDDEGKESAYQDDKNVKHVREQKKLNTVGRVTSSCQDSMIMRCAVL